MRRRMRPAPESVLSRTLAAVRLGASWIKPPWCLRLLARRPGLPGRAGLPAEMGLKLLFLQAAECPGSLDAYPDRGRGEIRQRDFLDLDDLHRGRVPAGGDSVLPGLVARLVEHCLPAARTEMENPVHAAADRGDGGADGIGRVEMIRPDDLADAGNAVRDEDAAAADGDQREVALRGLDPVDCLGEPDIGQPHGVFQQPPVALD